MGRKKSEIPKGSFSLKAAPNGESKDEVSVNLFSRVVIVGDGCVSAPGPRTCFRSSRR